MLGAGAVSYKSLRLYGYVYGREGDVLQAEGARGKPDKIRALVSYSPGDEIGAVPMDDEKPGGGAVLPRLRDHKVTDVTGQEASRQLDYLLGSGIACVQVLVRFDNVEVFS